MGRWKWFTLFWNQCQNKCQCEWTFYRDRYGASTEIVVLFKSWQRKNFVWSWHVFLCVKRKSFPSPPMQSQRMWAFVQKSNEQTQQRTSNHHVVRLVIWLFTKMSKLFVNKRSSNLLVTGKNRAKTLYPNPNKFYSLFCQYFLLFVSLPHHKV
jgi:hypothetical protein